MFTLEQLTKMTNKEIKEILREEKLVMSGNKDVLIARIIAHQEKEDKERHEHDVMLTHGAQIHSQEFEKIMGVFLEWCGKEGFRVHKYGKSGCSFETVDVNEIRYKLREITSLTEFYHEFFNTYLDSEWFLFSNYDDERMFDCDSEYNDEWMINGMDEIYNAK